MPDQTRRKELLAHYKQTQPPAGVYRILNNRTSRALLGSTSNLDSLRNKFEFGQATNSTGVLDQRLRKDAEEFGIDAFSLEVLEVLEIKPGMTPAEIKQDLATLELLWRERLDPSSLY